MLKHVIQIFFSEEIRKEIRDLKKDYKTRKVNNEKEAKIEETRLKKEDNTIKEYKNEVALYQARKKELPKKGMSFCIAQKYVISLRT